MRSFDDLLACPRCTGPLQALRCAACGVQYTAPGEIPDLRVERSDAEEVRQFYLRAPFPNYPPGDSFAALRARAARSEFARQLDAAIPGDAIVAELGCGTGQLSLFLASADRTVIGADLSRASLELAREAAARYAVEAHFVETDLRAPGLGRGGFDVVICSGVLHHTPDPRASFAAIATLARPGGILVIGLYNAFARLPQRLRRALYRATGATLFDPVLRARSTEPARREAWLRDQYLHPEEHRHTLREVRGWFRDNGVDYLRAFPGALFADESTDLFAQAEDEWPPEELFSQLAWMRSLGGEGGLFVVTGSKR